MGGGAEFIYDPISRELYDQDPLTTSIVLRDGYGSILITSVDGSPFQTITFTKYRDPKSTVTGSDGVMYTFMLPNGCDDDGIPNYLDLDSYNDGCPDAIEGGDNVTVDNVEPSGTVSSGNSLAGSNVNISGALDENGFPVFVNPGNPGDVDTIVGQLLGESLNDEVRLGCALCYKPGNFTAEGLPTNIGISSVRNNNSDNWPQLRDGGWIALESNTKGFVPNRLTSGQIALIPSTDLVVGMMVYNISLDCLQINVDGTPSGWSCYKSQSCL